MFIREKSFKEGSTSAADNETSGDPESQEDKIRKKKSFQKRRNSQNRSETESSSDSSASEGWLSQSQINRNRYLKNDFYWPSYYLTQIAVLA